VADVFRWVFVAALVFSARSNTTVAFSGGF